MRRASAAALAVACLLPAAAAAQGGGVSEEGSKSTVPIDSAQITAVAELRKDNGSRALEVYRQLVPNGYSMPAHPLVMVYLGEPKVPAGVPGSPYNDYTKWIEGPVSIRVRRGGQEGFFPLSMPVFSQLEFDLGRAVGLPKIFSGGFFAQTATGYTVQATVGGKPIATLDWSPGGPAGSEELRRAATFEEPLFTLFPALQGPDIVSFKITPNPPAAGLPLPQQQPGTVRLRLDPNLDALDVDSREPLPELFAPGFSLADVIDTDQVVPGFFSQGLALVDLESKKLGTGGGYSQRAGTGIGGEPPGGNGQPGADGRPGPPGDGRPRTRCQKQRAAGRRCTTKRTRRRKSSGGCRTEQQTSRGGGARQAAKQRCRAR